MSFSRIAQSERKLIQNKSMKEEMAERGWCEAPIPLLMLEQMNIEYESVSDKSRYSPDAVIYTPAWVWAARGSNPKYEVGAAGLSQYWVNVRGRIERLRTNYKEQELVCAELSLDLNAPRSVRTAAKNYVALLQQKRER